MNSLFSIDAFSVLVGLLFAAVAVRAALHRRGRARFGAALFWTLLAAIYLFGKIVPPFFIGCGVLAMVALAALRLVEPPPEKASPQEERTASAARLGNRLFLPALLIPATAICGTLLLDKVRIGPLWLLDHKQSTLAALGLGALVALGAALRVTRARPTALVGEGARLLEAVGWALVMPLLLAALGGIFAQAHVGDVVAGLVARGLPTHSPLVAASAYCVAMALFTICMGNAFAAFPVITLGIGLPLVVQQHHGNVAILSAIGMLSGYCGTLMTPMAANFNLVPAMLLEMKDRNGVIKAQLPIGLTILGANIAILYLTVYRF
jgi:uncharacterized membrane protein